MNAESIALPLPELDRVQGRMNECLPRRTQRESSTRCFSGQLSDPPRKSIEPIALAADLPPRNLRQFLSLHQWSPDPLPDRARQIIGRERYDHDAISVLDGGHHTKKGDPAHAESPLRKSDAATGNEVAL